jgi:predicted aspartyl protease
MRQIHFMLAALLCTTAASAQDAPTPAAPTIASAPTPDALLPAPFLAQPITLDRSDRITLPVTIGGEGPFAFVVDTGAERTVIARQLAERLGLTSAGRVRVIGLAEAVITDVYQLGPMRLRDLPIDGHLVPAFDHGNIGAAGLIGIDSLERHRVVIDFVAGRIDIRESPRSRRPAREPEFDRDAIIVVARRSAGRMILSDARIGGRRIDVIVDTGAQSSLGNVALRNLVRGQHGHWRGRLIDGEIQSVTGAPLAVQMGQISRITVGGVDFTDLPVAYADSPAFAELGLSERPALLLGMDALQMFERVAIDFTNRRVTFDLPQGARRFDPGRLALRTP